MKTSPSQFWALLNFEVRAAMIVFLYPVILGGQFLLVSHLPSSGGFLGFRLFTAGLVLVMAFAHLFQGGSIGFQQANTQRRTLEFPFTRAISRQTLFTAKIIVFATAVALTLAPGIVLAWLHPDQTIPLFAIRSAGPIKTFYLTQFPGATERTMAWGASLVLPDAARWGVFFICGATLFLGAAYMVLMFATWRFRMFQRFFPMVLLFSPLIVLLRSTSGHLSSGSGGSFDRGVAWVIAHPILFATVPVAAAIGAFLYGRRKFVALEVIE